MLVVGLFALLAPAVAQAQGPWTVSITPTVNPLAIGGCGPVRLALMDPATRDWPRNASGNYVSLADFDLSVTGVDRAGVAGEYNGPSVWSACACQGATVGSTATITATYPSQQLEPKRRATDVAFQMTAAFTIAKPRAASDVAACQALKNQAVAAAPTIIPSAIAVVPPTAVLASPATAPAVGGVPKAPITGTPVGTTTAPRGVPGVAPAGVAVSGTPIVARVSWGAINDPQLTGYTVSRIQGNGPPVQLTPAASTATQFVDTVPDPSLTYRYVVGARYANGTSALSSAVTFTPPPMTNPTNLRGTATAPVWLALYAPTPAGPTVQGRIMQDIPATVSLSWSPVAGATFYMVRWGNLLQPAYGPEAVIRIPDPGSYTFNVVAYFRNDATVTNYGDDANPSRVTVQVGPADGLRLTSELYPGQQYLRLHWTEPAGVIIREVWRADEGNVLWTMPGEGLGAGWAEARGTSTHPVTFGKSYRYRVILTTSNGQVLLSNQVPVTILPDVKPTFTLTSPAKDVALLSWNAMPGATGYEIWWKRWDGPKLKYFDEVLVDVPATQLQFRHLYFGPAPAQYTLKVLYGDLSVAPLLVNGSVVVQTH
jgi:hypothetical protein